VVDEGENRSIGVDPSIVVARHDQRLSNFPNDAVTCSNRGGDHHRDEDQDLSPPTTAGAKAAMGVDDAMEDRPGLR
jgi:hypothetical protein